MILSGRFQISFTKSSQPRFSENADNNEHNQILDQASLSQIFNR
jgi:hypothetical protein